MAAQVFERVISGDASSDERVKTLQRVVGELKTKHEILFKGVLKKLTNPVTLAEFETVAKTTIVDEMNWGRLVSILSFATYTNPAEAKTVAEIVDEMTREWIESKGGLDAAVFFFRPLKPNWQVWKDLACAIAILGTGAAAIYASRP